jgi:hypothetical protein
MGILQICITVFFGEILEEVEFTFALFPELLYIIYANLIFISLLLRDCEYTNILPALRYWGGNNNLPRYSMQSRIRVRIVW